MITTLKKRYVIIVFLALVLFIVWRFIRPMNIFLVDDRFAWPVDTSQAPEVLGKLSAEECAVCHQDFYKEWQTTIHSQAWIDPYFRTDWQFDDAQHSCRLCHTPLDRQQPQKVLAYRDSDKWDPVLENNPAFDSKLQHEGVTCAACHYRDGKIVGVFDDSDAPHPVKKLSDPNQICVRCHIVDGDRWDTFFRFPPCGTVAEIESTLAAEKNTMQVSNVKTGISGEVSVFDTQALACVECHMPLLERPLVVGGKVRTTRQHLWRGGHDPEMVKKALTIDFSADVTAQDGRTFTLTITNTGAAHYVPTGTPDRFLSVHLRSLDRGGQVLDEQNNTIKRLVMWRPFIIDLRDTRLPRGQPRQYRLQVPVDSEAVKVEAVVRYHLLDEARRKRIAYENTTPINYEIFSQQILLNTGAEVTVKR
jgi:cytochrome c553